MAKGPTRHVVAMGGGGFMMEPENPLLDDFILSLAANPRPRVCFLPTAGHDEPERIEAFHEAFPGDRARATHLTLFLGEERDPREVLLEQDVVYVGGGNTADMLECWRETGADEILREAWRRGVILAGLSAGMLCWFECGVTDSFGPLAPLHDGLGILSGSACPHYDGEEDRRPAYRALVTTGTLPDGLALEDGAAAHFVGRRLEEIVTSYPEVRGYRVRRRDGRAVETVLPARYLGEDESDR